MTYVTPGEADDDAQPGDESTTSTADDPALVTLAWASADQDEGHTPAAAAELNATQLDHHGDAIGELQTLVERQRDIIEDQRESLAGLETQVSTLHDRIEAQQEARAEQRETIERLQEQVTALQSIEGDIEDVESRTSDIEERLPELRHSVSSTVQDVNRLLGGVFDEERPCPNCDGGTIGRSESMLNANKIVCDTCEFEEAIPYQ